MLLYVPKHKKETSQNTTLKKVMFPVSAAVLFITTVSYWNNTNYGLALEYNGQQIAKVSDEKVYEKAENLIRSQVPLNEKHKINKVNPQIKVAPISQEECCKQPEIIKDKIVENSSEILNPGFSIYINDNFIATSSTKEEIENILNEIIEKNKNMFDESVSAEFEDKIEIKEGLFSSDSIIDSEKLREILNSKTQTTIPYTVCNEDSIVSIAEKFDMVPELLLTFNHKKIDDLVYPGDNLNVIVSDDLLHIITTTTKTVQNEIPFETIEEKDDNLERFKTILAEEGKNGIENVTYQIKYKNGKEIDTKEINRETVLNPSPEKIIIGTKCEEYIWPVPYTKNITSGFGPRWGTFHYGIDIAEPGVGNQDILASKNGRIEKVVISNSGYGNHVIINHEDDTKTLYAHCSELYVEKGQNIMQGEKIASVGSTGNSTGPHLHFEVMVNNVKKDPTKFVH